MPNEIFACEVKAHKVNNIFEYDVNSVLEGFKNYYSTLVENLVQLLPKPANKYSINTVFKYYYDMVEGYHYNLASASENLMSLFKSNSSFKSSWSGQSIWALSK